jgi:two-component system, sporulation sensor kinase B
MILILALSVMWAMSLILLFMRSQEKTNLWFSGLFFIQGIGIVEAIVEVLMIPNSFGNVQVLWMIRRFLATFCFRFFPYSLIMAGVSYSGFFNSKMKRRLKYLLFIPIIITFALDFIFIKDGFLNVDLPQSRIYGVTYIWAVPYYLFSNYLFYHAYRSESEKIKKQQRLLIFVVLSLPTLIIMIMSLTIAPKKDWWKYFLVQSFILTGIFLYFIRKYGLDGLKLQQQLGARIIKHTVKNELSKIHCNIDAVKRGLSDTEKAFHNIDMAAEHMYEIVDRIGSYLQDFNLECDNYNLSEIVDSLLVSLEHTFNGENIQIVKNYLSSPLVYCDKAHIAEVVNNVLINAVEAIAADSGRIFVELSSTKKQATIKISDNGVGIPADKLARVTNLFYSTKGDGSGIRGSGLYYCAAVIEKHHGEFRINSEVDIGTTVDIMLPLLRVTKKYHPRRYQLPT